MTIPSFDFDTETFLSTPGLQAPRIVCVQFVHEGAPPELIHARDPAAYRWVRYALESARISGHFVAYDMTCTMATWPDLTELVFEAYRTKRVICTELQQRLIDIAQGQFKRYAKIKGSYALDGVASRLKLDLSIDKSDPWRKRYGTLYHTDVAHWPEEARSYAILDAVAQHAVRTAQESYAAQRGIPLDDSPRQAFAGLALQLAKCRGVMGDPVQIERYVAQVGIEIDQARVIAEAHGLVRSGPKPLGHKGAWEPGTKDTKAAAAFMQRVCAEQGVEAPKTEAGGTSLDEDAIEQFGSVPCECEWCAAHRPSDPDELADWPSPLEAYQIYGSSSARKKRTEQLRNGVITPIQPSFVALIDTGRTACQMGKIPKGEPVQAWGAQLHNPPRVSGYRECFVPRPGHVFASIDYEGLELHTWAQACLWLVGHSEMARALNAGRDPHVELGAGLVGLSVEEAYACHRKERGAERAKWFKDEARQPAKPGNFGYPVKMGAAKMVLSARKGYGVILGKDPLNPTARVPAACALAAAEKLKATWCRTWPEGPDYWDYVSRIAGRGELATIRQLRSGRMRGGVWFSAIANGFFQGLAADLAKDALTRVTYEIHCVRSSPLYQAGAVWNFVHDEILAELREEQASEGAKRISEIMIETAQEWCPDLRFKAPPALMRRWRKDAEPIYNGVGDLIPYDDKDTLKGKAA